ncbi:VCBS domain-containing protein [Pseudovibrio sp. Ad5]|uniref:VCBS domain-containing protein n=1 Tax=Pseudovibrio sp. Ad5 TaxID=989436 RepID=UPI0007AE40F4|nr:MULTISPECIES: Ig-like domain-containing protein [unclassified Pseudovibrio]
MATAEPITKTVTVTINGANDAPLVSDIATSTTEDNSVLIEPVFSDADSSDTHTITFDAIGTTGEVSLIDGKFQYDPNGQFEHLAVGETATDTFTYTVDDGNGEVVAMTATITINGTNDAPIVSDIATSTSEDTFSLNLCSLMQTAPTHTPSRLMPAARQVKCLLLTANSNMTQMASLNIWLLVKQQLTPSLTQ